jgi:hypothetical protein
VLISLAGATLSFLLLGFGLCWKQAAVASVIVFALAMISLLAGTLLLYSRSYRGADFGTQAPWRTQAFVC